MSQFELVGFPLYFLYNWSAYPVAESNVHIPTMKKKKIHNLRVIATGKSKVVSAVNFMLILVRI